MNETGGAATELRTFQPHDALAPYVRGYYSVDAPTPRASQIIAASTRQTLTFHYGPPVKTSLGGVVRPMYELSIGGAVTVPYQFRPQADRFQFFIVEFSDVGIRCLLGRTAAALVDGAADAMSVLPGEAAEPICDALYEIDDVEHKASLVDRALLTLLPRGNPTEAFGPIIPAIERIREAHGWFAINELLDGLNTSERNARRLFREVTGLSPKSFARILRFTDAFSRLWELEDPSELFRAIHLEDRSEYTDQAHFINEFTAFTGYSPTTLPKERFETFRLLNEVSV